MTVTVPPDAEAELADDVTLLDGTLIIRLDDRRTALSVLSYLLIAGLAAHVDPRRSEHRITIDLADLGGEEVLSLITSLYALTSPEAVASILERVRGRAAQVSNT